MLRTILLPAPNRADRVGLGKWPQRANPVERGFTELRVGVPDSRHSLKHRMVTVMCMNEW